MNYLLTNRNTRVFSVDLAKAIGLNEAIVLQQIQYWVEVKETDKDKYKDSFRDGYMWVYNSIPGWQEQLPFWSYDTVKRTLKSLENKCVLISGIYNKEKHNKTKWYRIDYEKLEQIVAESIENTDECKLPSSKSADCPHRTGQNCTTNTKEYTENTTKISFKGIKGNFSAKNPNSFSYEILERQIISRLKSIGYKDKDSQADIIHIIKYYYKMYKYMFGENHPVLSNDSMDNMLRDMICGDCICEIEDTDAYEMIIEKHFVTEYENCDYNICHFMSGEIRNNRFYEVCY